MEKKYIGIVTRLYIPVKSMQQPVNAEMCSQQTLHSCLHCSLHLLYSRTLQEKTGLKSICWLSTGGVGVGVGGFSEN